MRKLKFYDYDVYEDGRVYSNLSNKFLRGDIVHGYLQYTISINKHPKRIKAHRLVALLFLEKPESQERLVINHKDGNKLNNHFSNLEWCTYQYNNYHARVNKLNDISVANSKRWDDPNFRKRTSQNISRGLLKTGCNKGENNPRFRYLIFDKNGNQYERTELADFLKLSQSYTDTLIKRKANGISNQYFDKYGIWVKDMKRKVNRLSKAAAGEENATWQSE